MAAERKGAELETLPLNFGIEDTESINPIDAESFFLDSDPEEVTPLTPPSEESPVIEKKVTAPTNSKQPKVEKKEVTVSGDTIYENENENEEKDFFGDEDDEDEKEEQQDDENQPTDEEKEDVNVFQTYSEALLQMGIFSLDEGEQSLSITSPEDFKARWIHERKKDAYEMLDQALARHGKKHQDFLVSVFNGVDPEEYFSIYSNIENISNLDITKEDHQKIVYREALKRQGLSGEKIEKKLQRAIELGELEDDAKDFHEILLGQEQERLSGLETKKAQELENKQREKQHYENGIRTVLSKKLQEQEFDGIPVNNKVANEVYDFLTTDKYQLESGELLTEFDKYFLELKRPENYEKRLKVALLFHSDLNLESVKKVAVSKETDHLFSSLKKTAKTKQPTTTAKKPSTPPTPRFKFNFSE